MQVYVANASRNLHLFEYRIPENPQLRHRYIPAMGQAVLPDDMNQMQIDYLVEKMSPYGFVSVEDVKSKRMPKGFTRLIYSVDRPVSEVLIANLVNGNLEAQKETSRKVHEEIAYQTDRQITKDVEQAQQKQDLADLHSLKFQVEEQEPQAGFERPEAEVTNVVYQVAPDAQRQQQQRGGKGRRRH